MKNKYFGYYKDKTRDSFYKVLWNYKPRYRYVDDYTKIGNRYSKIGRPISTDYLRLHCERISESEFKKYIQ